MTPNEFQEFSGIMGWMSEAWRPDITTVVSLLQRFVACPTEEHWKVGKQVLRYLAGTRTLGICSKHDGTGLVGYSDADWAGELETPRTGKIIWFNGLISWGSKLQGVNAMSGAKSEYMAVGNLAKEMVGMRNLAVEMWIISADMTIPLYSNNTAAIPHQQAINELIHKTYQPLPESGEENPLSELPFHQ